MPQSEAQMPDKDSKSQRKRDMLELQKIGEALLKLSDAELLRIDLADDLREAIQHAKSLTSNEAKRRQLQYIGKIIREYDAAPIKLALSRLKSVHAKKTEQFHQTEAWREKLITQDDEALNVFLAEHPNAERQPLRQLIRKAQQDRKNAKNTGAEKALFQYLRGLVQE